jgi:hypothetical protein
VIPRTGIKTVAHKRVNCGRPWCGCDWIGSGLKGETDALTQKLQGVCWGDLAQYECVKDNPLHHERLLDKAYEDCAKENKILLYLANTGG